MKLAQSTFAKLSIQSLFYTPCIHAKRFHFVLYVNCIANPLDQLIALLAYIMCSVQGEKNAGNA
jgi:hypothetical protein